MSTTSYAEKPLTHRVNNIGSSLFRLIGMTNSSAGDDTTGPSGGFDSPPELSNRWFRGYRWTLTDQPAPEHRHVNPVVVVLVSGSGTLRSTGTTASQSLPQAGAFVFLEPNVAHTLQAVGPETQVVEVEIRRPR
jgi:hypothetical protein